MKWCLLLCVDVNCGPISVLRSPHHSLHFPCFTFSLVRSAFLLSLFILGKESFSMQGFMFALFTTGYPAVDEAGILWTTHVYWIHKRRIHNHIYEVSLALEVSTHGIRTQASLWRSFTSRQHTLVWKSDKNEFCWLGESTKIKETTESLPEGWGCYIPWPRGLQVSESKAHMAITQEKGGVSFCWVYHLCV